MTELQISTKKRVWRFGIPKEEEKDGKIAVIITLKNDMGWNQTCLLNYMISHPEFFELKKALCKVDLENAKKLKNPETLFLLKDIKSTIKLLNQSTLPPESLHQLNRLRNEFNDTISQHFKRPDFPQDLVDLLNFQVKEQFLLIKPRQYLNPENFFKILSIVKEHGGEYVSNGSNSHFKLPT